MCCTSRSCCGLPLQTGVMAIGIGDIVWQLAVCGGLGGTIGIFYVGLPVLQIVADIFLILAAVKRNKCMVIYWEVVAIINIIGLSILAIYLVLVAFVLDSFGDFIGDWGDAYAAILMVFAVLFTIEACVYCYWTSVTSGFKQEIEPPILIMAGGVMPVSPAVMPMTPVMGVAPMSPAIPMGAAPMAAPMGAPPTAPPGYPQQTYPNQVMTSPAKDPFAMG